MIGFLQQQMLTLSKQTIRLSLTYGDNDLRKNKLINIETNNYLRSNTKNK